MQLKILDPRLKQTPPAYQTLYSAGLDLRAMRIEGEPLMDEVKIWNGETLVVGTGIAVAIPRNQAGQILIRSGIATKSHITLANGTGLIDPDYRGELLLALRRGRPNDSGYFVLQPGQRVAQLIVTHVVVGYELVNELPITARGTGGFGSTGGH